MHDVCETTFKQQPGAQNISYTFRCNNVVENELHELIKVA